MRKVLGNILYLIPSIYRLPRRIAAKALEQYYKQMFASVGTGVRLRGHSLFTGLEQIAIGDNVHIGDNATVRGEGGLLIGSHTHIARNCVIYTVNHNYKGSRLPYDESLIKKPVSIGECVWIGINCIVLPGTTIGDGAIIGAGSVVSRDIESLAIAAGNPAKALKYRESDHFHQLYGSGEFGGCNGNPIKNLI